MTIVNLLLSQTGEGRS